VQEIVHIGPFDCYVIIEEKEINGKHKEQNKVNSGSVRIQDKENKRKEPKKKVHAALIHNIAMVATVE
jgi:hypothetical protein